MRLGRGSDASVGARGSRGGGGPRELDPRVIGGGIIGCLGAILVLLLLSFAVVAPTEFGVKYDHLFQKIADKAVGPGRKFVGPWTQIITYPSVVRTIEFSSGLRVNSNPPLKTRTIEGLDLTVHVSFQYALKKEALPEMYKLLKDNYVSIFTRRATSSLLAVAGGYKAVQYWSERKNVSDKMQESLTKLFAKEATIKGLQLLVIDLPAIFEQKIVETEVQKQIVKTRLEEQVATVVRAGIDVIVANKTRERNIIENQASADALLLERKAMANAQKDRLEVESTVMVGVKTQTSLSTKGLVDYQRGVAYQNLDQAQFIFGADQTAAILNVNSGLGAYAADAYSETSARQLHATPACTAALKESEEGEVNEAPAKEVANPEWYTPMTPTFDKGFLT